MKVFVVSLLTKRQLDYDAPVKLNCIYPIFGSFLQRIDGEIQTGTSDRLWLGSRLGLRRRRQDLLLVRFGVTPRRRYVSIDAIDARGRI